MARTSLARSRAPSEAPATPTEVHHQVPRCLLRLYDAAQASPAALDGAGVEAWLSWEHEAMRWGVDPEISRPELEALISRSTVLLERSEHRRRHESDFARWGRLGGLQTLRRYGRGWFSVLGRRSHLRWIGRRFTERARLYPAGVVLEDQNPQASL